MRYGPDLSNFSARKPPPDTEELMKFLYAGTATHPSYSFLFEERPIVGERSADALNLGANLAPAAGRQVVPTNRAEALVTYLQSLKVGYEYPESKPVTAEELQKQTK
jgi:cytochrome c oxidase cbb3-type subunit 2